MATTETSNYIHLNENDIDNILDEIEEQDDAKQIDDTDIDWKHIIQQIKVKNVNFIKTLITSKEIDVNTQNPSDGKTLLIYAVIIGDLHLVTAICNFGADVKIKDKDDLDALDYAIKYGRYPITELVYYQQLQGSLGNDLKKITKEIRKKNKEAKYIYEEGMGLHQHLVFIMIKAIKARAAFDGTMLYYAWYFVLKYSESLQQNPFHHNLWKAMMNTYQQILSNTSDTDGWKWLKQQFVPSIIWYLPHPNNHDIKDNEDQKEEMESVLQTTLFYELLHRVRAESKKQADLLLKQNIDRIKNERIDEWNKLISYNVKTEFSSDARQDRCGCLQPQYSEDDLSEDKYPGSTYFSAKRHYDTNIYLNQLLFRANVLDTTFQNQMRNITKAINKETGNTVAYTAGPVKTLTRSQAKVENDYINEDWPTSAKILDINRCALHFKNIKEMMKYIELFSNKIKTSKAGCIKQIIRCKNGWSVYNEEIPQYTDIKLNVLVKSQRDGIIIAEIQFLLELMSCFKKKAHKLYGIERKFELVYNYCLLTRQMAKFQDLSDIHSVLNDLAKKDDLKFFTDLWQNSTPNVALLMNMKSGVKVYDNAVMNILMSSTGAIHNYLQNNHRAFYRAAISFYINNVVGSWDVFVRNLTTDSSIKLEFMQKFTALFDETKKVTDYDGAVQILRSFGVIYDFSDHYTSSFVIEHKAFNFCTLKTPIYSECDGFDDHKNTEFKFVNDSFTGGSLYMFGVNKDGRLGLGDDYKDKGNVETPTVCETFKDWNLLEISSWDAHSLAVDVHGNVYAWGKNNKGQLGIVDGDTAKCTPCLLPSFCAFKAIHVAVGVLNSLIVTENGQVWSCGKGSASPVLMEALKDEFITHVSCGGHHNCAISQSGKLFTWGTHMYGQCGLGDKGIFIRTPTEITDLNGLIPLYTACGLVHTLLLTSNGAIWSFGKNNSSQLGHNQNANQKTPKLIGTLLSKRVIDIACGTQHSLCVTEDGELYYWGETNGRQDIKTPKKMNIGNSKVLSCAASATHSAVVTTDGLYMLDATDKEKGAVEYFKQHNVASVALGKGFCAVITQPKDDEKKDDDGGVYNLKPNQEIHFKNKMQNNQKTNSFKVYMKNEKLFKRKDWFLMAQNKSYSAFPGYTTAFVDNLQIGDNQSIELKDNKMEKIYHSQVLQSKYALLVNENKPQIKEESVSKNQIFRFSDIGDIKFKIPTLNETEKELTVSIYVQPLQSQFFVLLKELKI